MTRRVCFTNEKGGVAKSTTCEAFAASLRRRGMRVLMVDLDAQPGNLTFHVGGDKAARGTYELLTARRPTRDEVRSSIQPTEAFGDLMAADVNLADVDSLLDRRIQRELVLCRALDAVEGDYDFVLIDTPPALQVRTTNGIAAADDVIVPTLAEVSSAVGVMTTLQFCDLLREASPRDVRIAGVAIVSLDMVRRREGMEASIAEGAGRLGARTFSTRVRCAVAARDAQERRVPLVAHAPASTAARDYEDLVDEYLEGIATIQIDDYNQ